MDQGCIVLVDFDLDGVFYDDGAGGKEVRNVVFLFDSYLDLMDLILFILNVTGAVLVASSIRLSFEKAAYFAKGPFWLDGCR